MADETLTLDWIINPAGALSGAASIRAALLDLERIADRVGPKLKNIAAGMATPIGAASRSASALAGNLNKLEKQATETGAAVGGLKASFGGIAGTLGTANARTKGLSGSLGMLGGSVIGITLVHKAVSALHDGLEKARDYARATAEENFKLRDSLRELKALNPDKSMDQLTERVIDDMRKSGATPEESEAFNTIWDSTLPAARARKTDKGENAWQLDAEQEKQFKEKMLQLAVAKGAKPDALAEVIAGMGLHQPVTSVDQAVGQAGMELKMGSNAVGRIKDVMKQTKKLAPTLVRPEGGGAAESDAELSAIIAAATAVFGTPNLAATGLKQMMRESNTPAATKIGITPEMRYHDRLGKFKAVIDAGKAKGLSESQSLTKAGFRNQAANSAIISLISARTVSEKWAAEARMGGDSAQVDRDIQEFKDQNPKRFAAASEKAQDLSKGKDRQRHEEMRQYAETGGKARGLYNEKGGNFIENVVDYSNPARWFGLSPGLRAETKDQVIGRQIREQIPDAEARFPTLGKGGTVGEDDLEAILNSLTPEEYKKVTGAMARYARKPGEVAAEENAASPAGSAFGGTKPNGAVPTIPRSSHIGGPQASAAGGQSDSAAEILKPVAAALMAAAQAQMSAAREQMNPFATLPDLGGPIGPMRA